MTNRRVSAVPQLGETRRKQLSNGMTLLVRENSASATVVVQGYVRAGSIPESIEQAGLAAFTASLLSRGTESRSFERISEAVEGLGASLGVSGGRHVTRFHAKSLAEDLPDILTLLADILQRPAFPADQIEKARGQWLTDLRERDNDTQRMAALAFRELLYGAHPYGRSLAGYHKSISRIGRGDVESFYRRYYGPQGAALAVVGAVEADVATAMVEQAFGAWAGDMPAAAVPHPAVGKPEGVRRRDTVMAGKTQSDIVMGWVGPARTDYRYYAALLANTVLGRFGMYGRLGLNVREKLGMAYYCLSSVEAGIWPGPWNVSAGVNPANVDGAVAAIGEEVARLCGEPVTEGELADSKAFLAGSLPLKLESSEGIAGILLEIERYDLGLDYLERYPELIGNVGPGELQDAAAEFINPQAYALAVSGPELTARGTGEWPG